MSEPTTVEVTPVAAGVARIAWHPEAPEDGLWEAVGHVAAGLADALTEHARVEALVDPDDRQGQRIATWAGMRREGVMRGVRVGDETVDRVVYARLADDPGPDDPHGFRALLNSFLPRKRAIGQMLIRDEADRVLLCRLTYKEDWDLPGGVVEGSESPRHGVAREVAEELGLAIEAGELVLTDWLPPWGGWDDALCLVFDGGVHDSALLDDVVREEREIREVAFCSPDEVRARTTDFTARRVEAALGAARDQVPRYTESGR